MKRIPSHKNHPLIVFSVIFVTSLISSLASPAFPKSATFQREYVYQAGEADSKLSCRAISLEQVKRLLLEELGTYLESETEVKNFQLTRDQITSLTAGVVKTEIVSESWDGQIYKIKAQIIADPDGVAKAIDNLRTDRQKSEALARSRAEAKQYLQELEKLKKELADARREGADHKKQLEYGRSVNKLTAVDWYEQGLAQFGAGVMDKAVFSFTKALEVHPEHAGAVIFRGNAYTVLNKPDLVIGDYDRALRSNPQDSMALTSRANAWAQKGDNQKALEDYSRALRTDPRNPLIYTNRGLTYDMMDKKDLAIKDYTTAINLSPDSFLSVGAYANRGSSWMKLGKIDAAMHTLEQLKNSIGRWKIPKGMPIVEGSFPRWEQEGLFILGQLYRIVGQDEKTLDAYLLLVGYKNDDAGKFMDTYTNLAKLYTYSRNPKVANNEMALKYGLEAARLSNYQNPGSTSFTKRNRSSLQGGPGKF